MGLQGVPLDHKEIIDAIGLKKGILKLAAEHIGCTPAAIYAIMKTDPLVKDALKIARDLADEEKQNRKEYQKDLAFDSLEVLLQKYDVTMTIFILKTLCGFDDKSAQQFVQFRLLREPTNKNN